MGFMIEKCLKINVSNQKYKAKFTYSHWVRTYLDNAALIVMKYQLLPSKIGRNNLVFKEENHT